MSLRRLPSPIRQIPLSFTWTQIRNVLVDLRNRVELGSQSVVLLGLDHIDISPPVSGSSSGLVVKDFLLVTDAEVTAHLAGITIDPATAEVIIGSSEIGGAVAWPVVFTANGLRRWKIGTTGGLMILTSGEAEPSGGDLGAGTINVASNVYINGVTVGDVHGPATSTNGGIATFNGTGGKTLQNNTTTIANLQLLSEKDQANGYAGLSAGTKLSGTQQTYGFSANTALEGNTKLDDLATPDDNTDLDATSGQHGLLPKLSGTSTTFLDGTGAWTAVDISTADVTGTLAIGNGGTGATTAANARTALDAAEATSVGAHTITLAKITAMGTDGSITWNADGVVESYVDPT